MTVLPLSDPTESEAPEKRQFAQEVAAWAARPRVIGIAIYLLLFAAFACWTVQTSGYAMVFGAQLGDYYNQLADAFLHGNLALATQPPPDLLHLSNPYDPALNHEIAQPYHDLALYNGHFYLAWGPTAAFVLFLPWRIFGLGDASQAFAIVVFSTIGLLFTSMLFCWLVDRYFVAVRNWKILVSVFALGLCSVTPFLMRRPDVYEVAISCAYMFVAIGLYALASGAFGDRFRPIRVGVGSACIGLAIMSRVDLAILVLIPLAIFVREWSRRGRPWSLSVARFGAPILGPVGFVVAMMLAYNQLRFGAPFEFGSIYQLAGVEQLKNFNYRLSSIAPGMFYYFVAPVQWTLAFPFFLLAPPPFYPWIVPGYMQSEQAAGVLTEIPILITLFLAPFCLRKKLPRELAWLCAALALSAVIIAGVIAWGIPGTTQRYESDFATLLLIPALLCWIAFMEPARARSTRNIARVLGTLFVVYGALVGAGLSITGYYDNLRNAAVNQYRQLGNFFGFVPHIATIFIGHPVIVKDTYMCGNGACGTHEASLSHWDLNNGYDVELDVVAPTGGWQVTMHAFNTHGGHGETVLIRNGPHYSRTYKTTEAQRTIAVPLQAGLNRVDVIVPGSRLVSFYALKTERVRQPAP